MEARPPPKPPVQVRPGMPARLATHTGERCAQLPAGSHALRGVHSQKLTLSLAMAASIFISACVCHC